MTISVVVNISQIFSNLAFVLLPDGDWKVWITTAESASGCRVAMVAYGDRGNSGPILLGDANELFQAGNKDEFKVGEYVHSRHPECIHLSTVSLCRAG